MFIIILTQSSATARTYATRYNEQLDENRDLIGLGLANIGAALSGTFVVNGSPTQSQMVNSAGGRSQLAQLTAAAVVVGVLIFLTGPLAYMPSAVLAAIVLLIARDLIDIRGMRKIFLQRRSEFWVALITSATVFFVGVEQGIILAMFLSLLDHVRGGYRPRNSVISIDESGSLKPFPIASHEQLLPGLIIYRFNHSMYYANADLFSREISDLGVPPLSWLCLDLDAVDDVDFSAAAAIRAAYDSLKQRGIRLVLAEVSDNVSLELDRYGITELIGIDGFFRTIIGVRVAFKRTMGKGRPHEGS
jgi:MFS superfamily sulfate permease-like transporter